MSFQKCIEHLKAAAGRELTDDEVDYLFTEVRRKRDAILAAKKADDLEGAALQAADEVANNIQLSAVIQKRNAALNLSKRMRHTEWSLQNYGSKIVEPLETILVGTNRAIRGARDGVAQTQKRIVNNYLSGLTNDLVQADMFSVLSSGTMDREITRALWSIGKPTEKYVLANAQPEAVAVAKIINKWEETARVDANKEGAWIRKAAGYVVRQSHDPLKITKAGMTDWLKDARKYFDIKKMIEDSEHPNINEMLNNLFMDLSSGNHLKGKLDEDLSGGFDGSANIAKRLSKSREILFKNADAWFDYNEKYGGGNLRESLVGGLRVRAEATGMMRVLGTNPEDMLKRIETHLVENAKEARDGKALKDLNNARDTLNNYLLSVDGTMNVPIHAPAARVAANVRSWQTLSKLGGMLLSQLNDTAIYGASMSYNGRSFLGGIAESIGGLGRQLKTKERMDLLASLDVVLESMTGEIGRIGTIHDPGAMTRQMQLFMKLNGSTWWTERMRASASLGLSHNLARNKGIPFGKLNADLQRNLRTYGIDPNLWDMLSSLPEKLADGREYLTADQVRTLPDSMFENRLIGQGKVANETSIKNARIDLENSVRNYIVDNTSFAVLEPDQKTRAIILQGTQPGTWKGEFFRFLMQFKSFTAVYMQKTLGRELYGRGYKGDSIFGALAAGNGEFKALTKLMVMTTAMGYGSLVLKDLTKGRQPRDISDPDQAARVMLAAMVQGGGAGIYGDFLFGEANRFGGGTLDTLAGPTIGTAASVADLFKRARDGDDVAASTLRVGISNTPYLNLFYTRMGLDYAFLYDMQESLNPGYLRRMERRIEKQNSQTFLVRPSEGRAQPFTGN